MLMFREPVVSVCPSIRKRKSAKASLLSACPNWSNVRIASGVNSAEPDWNCTVRPIDSALA